MEKKKVKYSEGDLFSISLDNQDKYLGLIVKRKGRTKLLVGYFWRIAFDGNKNLVLNQSDATLITKFSGLGFEVGDWNLVGKYPKWNKTEWAIPKFKRYNGLLDLYFAISYDDNLEEIFEQKITHQEAKYLFEDGSHGYISLENLLKTLI